MKLYTTNPATEKIIRKYKAAKVGHVPKYVARAKRAFLKWSKTSLNERLECIQGVKQTLLKHKEEYAEIITTEMGKPINQSIAEIEKCASVCDYYVKNAHSFLADEHIKTEFKKSYVKYEPLGVIVGIMPWNFPFWQFFRFAIPALAAGNTVILRHSTSVIGSGEEMESIFRANMPKNVVQNLICDREVADALIQSDGINGVSFTGSTEVGRRIGQLAGKNLKKFVLELGGSDPFIVLEDADIKLACETAMLARFNNAGQVCNAAKRFIVHKKRYEEFKEKIIQLVSEMKIGNPMEKDVSIGPLVSKKQLETIEKQVNQSVEGGAKVEIGGKRVKREGFFFEPTVLSGISRNNVAFTEELFGPILPIIKAKNDKQTIALANDSQYGLGASIWSRDARKAEEYAKKIVTGNVFINQSVRSNVALPFGGAKNSGFGRELGEYGIKEFCNIKTIVVR